MRPFPKQRADALAKRLELDVNCGICHACLSFVIFALDEGNPHRIRGALVQWTPVLWAEGLAEPAFAAVRGACGAGVPHAEAALADLELRGGGSGVARAIVRRLAEDLARRTRMELRLEAHARERLRLAPPELN